MDKRKVQIADEVPTIVVDSSSRDDLPFADEESTLLQNEGSTEEPEHEKLDRRDSLRRNSISLPNLDDLDVLKQKVAAVGIFYL